MGKRIGAYILDAIFVGLIYAMFVLVVSAVAGEDLMRAVVSPEYARTSFAYRIIMMAMPITMFVYGWLGESGKHNATWGKRITKIVVAGKTGNKAKSLDVMVRNIMKVLPSLVSAVFVNIGIVSLVGWGYEIINAIMVLASKEHRGIHDRVADTKVICKENLRNEVTLGVEDVKITLPTPEELKKNFETPEEKTVAPVQTRSLLAIDGQYNGAQFPLDLPIIMGREAKQCNIVFAADTQGVSKAHCEVKVVDGKVLITDLGSTYGTMINNEVSLRANETVELNVGDSFRIGKHETYIVK